MPSSSLRRDLLEFLVSASAHRDCEDGWYSCPKHPGYLAHDDRTYCDCGADQALALIKRFNAGELLE